MEIIFLILNMSEIFENLMGDFSTQWKYLPVAFVKYTSLQLYSYCTWNCIFLVLLETVETLVLRWLFSSSKCSYMCLLFCPKNSKTSSRKNSTTQKWLIVESCLDKWHFDALSIDVQYILSLQWSDFRQKCLLSDVACCVYHMHNFYFSD